MTTRPAEEESKKPLVIAARFTWDNYLEGKLLSTFNPALAADTARALSVVYGFTVYSVWSIEDPDHAKHCCAFMNGEQQ